MKRFGALLLTSLVAGCFGPPKVVRVYDGRVIEGAFVSPEAYSAYLRGVLAEESGSLRVAIKEYESAAREDDDDPEPWTRAGAARCRLDPKDKGAENAFSRAARIDSTYAPLIAARARCLSERGKIDEAASVMDEVASDDRQSANIEALFVRLAAARSDSPADRQARSRAIALTLASGDRPAAWDALVAWGRGKADAELFARGLEGLMRVAPNRRPDIEAGVLELLGTGQTTLARRVAGRLADMPPERGLGSIHDPTVARLAIDDALVAGDGLSARKRAIRGHVEPSEVAARALLLERQEIALEIASAVLAADPAAAGASMVALAVSAGGGVTASAAQKVLRGQARVSATTDLPAAACVLVLAERLAASTSSEIAHEWTRNVRQQAMAAHDPVIGPLAVDLAARGAIDERTLPLELRLELMARRREPPPALDVAAVDTHVVDAKHALLWHLLLDPAGREGKRLLGRLYSAAERDPIVGYALARTALASPASTASTWNEALRVIAAAPANPLLLAVAVDLAKKGGRPEDLPPARARLLAFARTPAERALATE